MTRSSIVKERLALLGISSLALAFSACNGSGTTAPWRRPANDSYVAQRPPFDENGRKNFFVSGYAGATYGPLVPRSRMPRQSPSEPGVSLGEPRTIVEEGSWPIAPE